MATRFKFVRVRAVAGAPERSPARTKCHDPRRRPVLSSVCMSFAINLNDFAV
jgi:hypothetical protein